MAYATLQPSAREALWAHTVGCWKQSTLIPGHMVTGAFFIYPQHSSDMTGRDMEERPPKYTDVHMGETCSPEFGAALLSASSRP